MPELVSQRRGSHVSDAPSLEGEAKLPAGRLGLQRELLSSFKAATPTHQEQIQAFLQMPEQEQQKALALMAPEGRTHIERAQLQRALALVVGVHESAILVHSDLSNGVLREALLHAHKVPRLPPQEKGRESIGGLLEGLNPPSVESLKAIPDEVLKKALAASTLSEMARVPGEISSHIFQRLQGNPADLLAIQRSQFENEHLTSARMIRDGAHKNGAELGEQLREAILPDPMSTQNSAHRMELQGWREREAHANGFIARHTDALQTSQAHQRVAQLLSVVNAHGEDTIKSEVAPHVVKNLNASSAVLFISRHELDTRVGGEKIREAGKMLASAADGLDTLVKGMTIVRDGSFVVVAAGAATLAAPVVFGAAAAAGASTALSTAASIGASAAVGAVVDGTLTAVSEAGAAPMHVALGNKTVEQAQRDFAHEVAEGTKRGAIAGLQGGAASMARVGIVSYLGRPETLTTAQTLGVAAASNALGRASAIPFERMSEYLAARDEFHQQFGKLPLTEEAKAERFAQFLASKGLTVEGISKQALKDILFSAGTAAIGAKFQLNRQAVANPTLAQNLRSEGAEFATNFALGAGKTYLETPPERRTFANLVSISIGEAFSATTGALQGRATAASASLPNRAVVSSGPRLTDSGAVIPHDMNVVTHTSVNEVRQKYVDTALSQIEQTHNRPATAEERLAIEEFAGEIHSFWDKNERLMHVAKEDPELPDSLKAMHEALFIHERSHAEGKGEVEAIEDQAKALAERGLQMSFHDGEQIVSKIEEGSYAVLPSREEISEYVERKYSRAEELAPGLAAGRVGIEKKTRGVPLYSDHETARKVLKKYESTNAPLKVPDDATATYHYSQGGDCTDYHTVHFHTQVKAAHFESRSELAVTVEVKQYWHADPSLPPGQRESWRASVAVDLSQSALKDLPRPTKVSVALPGSNGSTKRVLIELPAADPTAKPNDSKYVQYELLVKEGSDPVIKGAIGDFDLMPNVDWKQAKGGPGAKRHQETLDRGHFR